MTKILIDLKDSLTLRDVEELKNWLDNTFCTDLLINLKEGDIFFKEN